MDPVMVSGIVSASGTYRVVEGEKVCLEWRRDEESDAIGSPTAGKPWVFTVGRTPWSHGASVSLLITVIGGRGEGKYIGNARGRDLNLF